MTVPITEGWFSNVSVHQSTVYASDQYANNIRTFTHKGGNLLRRIRRNKNTKWTEGKVIKLPFTKKGKHITFRVSKNKLSVCSNFHYEIYTCALDRNSTHDFTVLHSKTSSAKQLSSEMYICSEFNGNLLVADRRTNSFFTLNSDGAVLTDLQPPCKQPNCAVVDTGFLFAMCNAKEGNTLRKYRLL